MVKVERNITVTATIKEAFDFVADFRNLPKWNPNDESVELLTEGPLRLGSEFRIATSINDRKMILNYIIAEWGPPLRATYVTESKLFNATDYINFSANQFGTELTYSADFEFKGILKLIGPIYFKPILNNLFSENIANLKNHLGFVNTETS